MYGIRSGMVMQRNDRNVADILLLSDTPLSSVTYHGAAEGSATLTKVGEGQYRLTDLPVGGPYTVTVDGQDFTDVYVGDIWILAGQSNMQGVGWYRAADHAFTGDPAVRALFMEDEWRPAKHPLHSEWKAVDAVHTAVLGAKKPDTDFQGVGPGLAFGQRLHQLLGVPQGLICCAHGGTNLLQWSPAIKKRGPSGSLYAAMQRRVRDNGSHARGIFWYQGCADAFENAADVFLSSTERFIRECRKDLAYPDDTLPLPVVQVQLGRVIHRKLPNLEKNWVRIREAQRILPQRLSHVYTLSAVHLELDDLIHLAGDSQDALGRQAAETMVAALYGESNICQLPPTLRSCRLFRHPLSGWATIDVSFDHLHGSLTADGRPNGFVVTPPHTEPVTDTVYAVELMGDTARLRLHYPPEEIVGQALYYGYGLNPYANLTDQQGRAVPCFGPIPLDILHEQA